MKKEEKMMLRRELKLSWSIRLSLVNIIDHILVTAWVVANEVAYFDS